MIISNSFKNRDMREIKRVESKCISKNIVKTFPDSAVTILVDALGETIILAINFYQSIMIFETDEVKFTRIPIKGFASL